MNFISKTIILLTISCQVNASCDLSQFRWDCTIYPKVHLKNKNSDLIYCGDTRLYVTHEQFKLISHYQRAGVMMHLKIDDVFFDGPCRDARFDKNNPNNYRY